MSPNGEAASFDPAQLPQGRKVTARSASEQPTGDDLVSFTIEAATGRVVSVEAVDAAGARRELSDTERAEFAGKQPAATLEGIVEQAFEAGIDCVLGGAAGDEEVPKSGEDADLRRALLRSLIVHSAARPLTQRDVLARAIVGTLIAQGPSFAAAEPESSVPH
jgi:hypothetical protein